MPPYIYAQIDGNIWECKKKLSRVIIIHRKHCKKSEIAYKIHDESKKKDFFFHLMPLNKATF